MSSADDSQPNEVDAFLQLVRELPGPAQQSLDVARRLVIEPTEVVLAALVNDELKKQDG